MGLAVWTEDEAGPYGTHPYATTNWQPQGEPLKQPHEYLPNGTAKIITPSKNRDKTGQAWTNRPSILPLF